MTEELYQVLRGADFDRNSQGEVVITKKVKVKATTFQALELTVIYDWLEQRWKDLFGTKSGVNYKFEKADVWAQFVYEMNNQCGHAFNRTKESICHKIDNMVTQSK